MGAHKSKPLEVDNENVDGVIPSIEFLKAYNLGQKSQARARWV